MDSRADRKESSSLEIAGAQLEGSQNSNWRKANAVRAFTPDSLQFTKGLGRTLDQTDGQR